MEDSKTYVFGQDNSLITALMPLLSQRGIDAGTLAAIMNNNDGFGNNGWWLIFLLLVCGNGNWGNFGGNRGGADTAFLANQMNNDVGRDLLLQATQGTTSAINQLASNLNCDLNLVKSTLNSMMSATQAVGAQVGMSGLQVQNAIQAGDAALSAQLAQCCCDNRLLTTQQGYEAQIRTLEQTNQLGSQADRNTGSILSAIKDQNAMIVDQFCQVKERELQAKIDSLLADNTSLRAAISEGRQTQQLTAAFNTLDTKITELAAKQPNTVPVQWPNLVAVNNTPTAGYSYGYNYGFNPYGYGWGGNSYWG